MCFLASIFLCHQIPLFQQHPHLKQFVRPAIERAVQELVHPVVERSIKICLTTAEMIVKKVGLVCNGRYCLSFRSCYRLRAVPLLRRSLSCESRKITDSPSFLPPPSLHSWRGPRGAPTSFYYFTVYFF